jgi:hypothetical protein
MTEDTKKNFQQSGQSNPNDPREEGDRPQHDNRRPDDASKDPSRKVPGQESERKDREGSEDVEKRRAS